MVDTQRTFADIIALFADNVTGDISPQDARDFIKSVRPTFGGLYISASAETTISAVDTWTKVEGTTTETTTTDWSHTNNRLTYDGAADVHAHIAMSFTIESASGNQEFEFGVAKNGTILTSSILKRKIVVASEAGAAAVHTDAMMSNGDYLEMFIQNTTSSANATMTYGYLFGMSMFT